MYKRDSRNAVFGAHGKRQAYPQERHAGKLAQISSLEETDRLASYLMREWGDEIGDESAVDVAIRLLERFKGDGEVKQVVQSREHGTHTRTDEGRTEHAPDC